MFQAGRFLKYRALGTLCLAAVRLRAERLAGADELARDDSLGLVDRQGAAQLDDLIAQQRRRARTPGRARPLSSGLPDP